ncbi:TRAP transporter large permease [Crenobacter caeni]|uniref:TRAP transporter large permease protein n=1 Tax=Crenobacter caeni TaxID=2705474 RepID=A0A6B2KRI5_9NEIS|nr:TRAP transporter large permease [Crenobacter caeni]NDV12537.1 TRAP transporter large permease [Crenobacter caeni]
MSADIISLLFIAFFAGLLAGFPLLATLGVAGALAIWLGDIGLVSAPAMVWSGIAKYPLLALPLFVLAGMLFERAGVAARLVALANALVGPRRGAHATVAILVCLFLGGMSGSGTADAAAVAMVMIPTMTRHGYPPAFSASLIAAAGATAILIPPSIALIVYSVQVPQATVPALFSAGLVPGVLAGLALIAPALWLSWRHGFGEAGESARTPWWPALKDASWGIAAPIIILGGLRSGAFTPTEAAVVAVAYAAFVGMLVYRTLDLCTLYRVLVDSAEISAVVMMIIAMAGVFAHAGSTLGAFDALAEALLGLTDAPLGMLALIMLMLLIAGMLLDAVSILLIFLPILMPIVERFGWDPVWFGVLMVMNLAIGQFTPPMAVNLMVTSRIAGVGIEKTVRWCLWMMASMLLALLPVALWPELVLWLPRSLGY